jgi:ABC-type amino acid transport substrate-binding protein
MENTSNNTMLKKYGILIFLFCLMVFSQICFSGFLFSDEFSPSIEKILKRGELRIALYHKDIFPFFFHDKNGKLVGYDIDIAKKIASTLGVKPVFNRDAETFDSIIEMVAENKADIAVSLISVTLKRAEKVLFTKPYLVLHPVIIFNRLKASNFKYNNGRSISGVIGEKKGTSYVDFAKMIFKNPKITEYDSWDSAIKDLLKGNVVAVLRDESGVRNIFMESPSLSIRLKTVVLKNFEDNIAIAVNRKNTHLCYWLNLFLETYKTEKNILKIIAKYSDIK